MAEQFQGKVEITDSDGNTTIELNGNNGHIGVGTSAGEFPLHVRSSVDNKLILEGEQGEKWFLKTVTSEEGKAILAIGVGDNARHLFIDEHGKVGIGVWHPRSALDVLGAVQGAAPRTQAGAYTEFIAAMDPRYDYTDASNRELRIQTVNNEGGYNQYILYNGRITGDLDNPTYTRGVWAHMSGIQFHHDGRIIFLTDPAPWGGPTGAPEGDGHGSEERNINPTEAMHIQRDGKVIVGKVVIDGAAGDVILQNADCAEDFDLADGIEPEPGAVMVMDEDGELQLCNQAYDKRVAGVVSGAGGYRPGIILDRQPSTTQRAAIALIGKVFCKVDATYGPIKVGDMLTTAPTPGHAMKAHDPARAFGAVIGKARRALHSGTGLIPVLVSLQ